jgi:hypothetical protein
MTAHVASWTVLWVTVAIASAAPPARIQDLDFLAGRWGGTVEGFQADEIWSPAANGSLMGVYREMRDGKTTFFEFLTIEQEESGLVLRLRHFKPGMKPLDAEATVFNMTAFTSGKAVFETAGKLPVRMTFEQKGPDKLEILLEHKRENGEWTHELFSYTRQPISPRYN